MDFEDSTLCSARRFREVQRLDEQSLRSLLNQGSPRERIWAAWTLGMRLGDGFAEDARDRIASEPVPGVRRHMIVMMAGFGEIDVLAALARHDPDDRVRGTSMHYVAALLPSYPELHVVLRQGLHDPSDFVRGEVAAHLPDSWTDELELLADAPEDHVREVALGKLIAGAAPELATARLGAESSHEVRLRVWQRMIRNGKAAELLDALRRDEAAIEAFLKDAIDADWRFAWSELEPAVGAGYDDRLSVLLEVEGTNYQERLFVLTRRRGVFLASLHRIQLAYRTVERLDQAEVGPVRELLAAIERWLFDPMNDAQEGEGELIAIERDAELPVEYALHSRLTELLRTVD